MQHGPPEECAVLRVQAIQEQQHQSVQQAAPKQQLASGQRQAVLAPAQVQQPAVPQDPQPHPPPS